MKTGPDALGTPKMSPGAQNMKTGPDALVASQNESRCMFTRKRMHKVSVQQAVPFNLGYTPRFGLQVYRSYRVV
jgi:hypothetical protein